MTNAKRRKVEGERVKRSDSLLEDEIRQIEEFYLRDDISRILPGKKDKVSVKAKSGKEARQKRLLLVNLPKAMLYLGNSIEIVLLSKFFLKLGIIDIHDMNITKMQ